MYGKNVPKTGCCPEFDPKAWDEKEITWKDKLFVKSHVTSLFHVPLNFGAVTRRSLSAIEKAGAADPETIILADENSPWGADVYFSVTGEVPGMKTEKISGTFLAKVFEGPYRDAGKWAKEMKEYAKSRKGMEPEKLYFYYTTCPKCAKTYGKNYVVILAQCQKASEPALV